METSNNKGEMCVSSLNRTREGGREGGREGRTALQDPIEDLLGLLPHHQLPGAIRPCLPPGHHEVRLHELHERVSLALWRWGEGGREGGKKEGGREESTDSQRGKMKEGKKK